MAVAVVVMSATGCTAGGNPKTSGSASATSSADGTGCGSTAFTAPPVKKLPRSLTFTAIRKVDPPWGDEKNVVLVDKPVTAKVQWKSDRVDETAALAAIEDGLELPTSGTSDALSGLDRFLSGAKEKKKYVGYAAVEKVTVPLSLKCLDGTRVQGELSTWVDAEIGVVVCATRYGKGEAPVAALKAQAEFCN
ncbi:hypothetical protein [Streptomyces triticisoli]|uniref:hypothetical protein n=1 Tax=Streptomyces triticisoli TaxID=2182797 RepID=UPI0013008B74|nr:hypothetical protein [Streptomyces triticisoli]